MVDEHICIFPNPVRVTPMAIVPPTMVKMIFDAPFVAAPRVPSKINEPLESPVVLIVAIPEGAKNAPKPQLPEVEQVQLLPTLMP